MGLKSNHLHGSKHTNKMKILSTERIPIKFWLDDIDGEVLKQARNLANLQYAYKHIAIMPDAHVGYGMPIGGVMATREVIVPNAVGVDIGCGMTAVKSDIREIPETDLRRLVIEFKNVIPLGFTHHKEKQSWEGFQRAPDIEIIQKELDNAKYQLGTLGGGNHFIEIQQGDDGFIWIMIHSGSRNFGLKTATDFHQKAVKFCEKYHQDIPDRDLSFLPLDSKEGMNYFTAMNYALEFSRANRKLMMERIIQIIGKSHFPEEMIHVQHNYASKEIHFGREVIVHRKGAIKAAAGMTGIIPGSMGTRSYITEGLGNAESFLSSSHGAGRRLGRREAIRHLNLDEEQKKMGGIIGKPQKQSELEEAPGAYKPIDVVMANQTDLVRILTTLQPLANIKG
ncbi:RNA-splicing ligase RtcB, repairs tRNA damage [Flexilinea flocculi]|uniref:3'-phosphate/5'-hydroxy nucleic acid ligase n=2 Tax=Flexilinea flocculi TaxID=1678840 RepID=A0A0S7BW41_9CHLR|nr:RNA-splicing ligase RtcB, repairs tRNA damage [Flexilinea flocculi]